MLNHAAADESKLSTTLSLPSFRLLNDGKYIESENRMEGWVNMAQFYIVVPIVPSLSMASMVQCQYSFQHKTLWLYGLYTIFPKITTGFIFMYSLTAG